MKLKWFALIGAIVIAAVSIPAVAGADADRQVEDVLNQDGVGAYAEDAASLSRTSHSVRIRIKVPTPASGSYVYPAPAVAGSPEVFTAWAFIFNHPELCSVPCDGNDIGNTPAQGGVYNVDGVVADGSKLKMQGRIKVGDTPFAGVPLQSPLTAEVHHAIAPHGQFDPTDPSQLTTPIGSPVCGCWWVSLFVADIDDDDDDDDDDD